MIHYWGKLSTASHRLAAVATDTLMTMNLQAKQHRTFIWLAAFVVPLIVVDMLLALLVNAWPQVTWLSHFGTGWGLGQFLVLLGWLAFVGRTWITGWLSLCLIVYLVGAAYQFVQIKEVRYSQVEYLISFTETQFGILGCILPLLIMRTFRGWQWSRCNGPPRCSPPIKVEDWFLFSICLCCSLALRRIAQAREPLSPLFSELSMFGSLSLFVMIFVIPLLAISFAQQSKTRLLVKWMAMAVCVVGLIALGLYSEGNGPRDFQQALVGAIGFVGAFMWGALSLLAGGWRIVRAPRVPSALEGDETNHRISCDDATGRLHARIATAIVATVAILGVSIHYLEEGRQLAFYAAIQHPATYYQAPVERVDLNGSRIIGVKMSPTATDEDLLRVVRKTPHIERLELAGMQVTDESLKILSNLHKLQRLDVSRTRVTGSGLPYVRAKLERLSMAHTSIDLPKVMAYVNRPDNSIRKLDLSFCDIDDDRLRNANIDRLATTFLSLAGNPISDDGVSYLLDKAGWIFELDLSDTPTDGSVLEHFHCPERVKLDGTKISDVMLKATMAAAGRRCESISLRRTQITAALLPALSGVGLSLELGEGLITEQDLLELPEGCFSTLSLNGPEFTGECLTTGRITTTGINLSHSKTTDEIVAKLIVQGLNYNLNLSHTDVTEAGFRPIDSFEVNASFARVDFESLLKEPPICTRIMLRHEQLTPEQLVKAKRTYVVIDEDSIYEY